MNAEAFVERLRGVRPANNGWIALCPAHEDRKPSLSVSEAEGKILVHCFAGCEVDDICEAVGVVKSELFTDRPGEIRAGKKTSEATDKPKWESYIYKDEDGNALYKIKRSPDKQFYPYPFLEDGFARKAGWNGQERVPYRLPDLAGDETSTVFWVEGEKDADTLASQGFIATTSPGGTNAYRPEFAAYLTGRRVTVIPDNDSPGREYARQVAESLVGVAESVRWLELPGLAEKGDVSDFFAGGATKGEFAAFAENARDFASSDETFTDDDEGSDHADGKLELLSMGTDAEIPEQEYLVGGLIPKGHPSMIYGDGGVGKSVLVLSMACALAEGQKDWLGFELQKTNVAYLDYEMPFEEQVRRARKIASGLGLKKVPDNLYYLTGTPEYSWQAIKDVCLENEIGLVVVDSFGPALAGDMEASNDIIAYIRNFVRPLLSHDITVLFIDHQPKAQGNSYQDQTAFGSVYKRNLVRSQVQVEGQQDEEEPGKYRVIFRHKKHNFGMKLPPFGAELVFGDDIKLRSVLIDPETLMKEKDLKTEDRVLLALYQEGDALTKNDIGDRIASSAGTVANALTVLRKRDLITESDLKEGRMSKYVLMKKGEMKVELDLTGIPSENGWRDGGKGFIE